MVIKAPQSRQRSQHLAPTLRSAPVADRPHLRLVGQPSPRAGHTVASAPQRAVGEPILAPSDPRWVLAVRVAEQLEGSVLGPERRDRLIRLGRMLGLSPFDANLVIAIVQDQARRGHAADYCPTAGEAQLRMVPLPRRASVISALRSQPRLLIAVAVGTALALELLLLRWLF